MEILFAPAGRLNVFEFVGDVESVTVAGADRRATAQSVSDVCRINAT